MLRLAVGSNIAVDAIPLRRTPTDLRELLRSSLATLGEQAEASDIGLRVHVDDGVPDAMSLDRAKIAWAITALVGNALRYVRHGSRTMPGGTISVRASHDADAREVSIVVQDDGPGIAEDRLQTMFSRGSDAPGAPLALMMVRDVVAAHGGRFAISSDTTSLEHGTKVTLTLPAA